MKSHVHTLERGRRALYVSAGAACVGLGALGVVVPGLPTTVFLLAASYLFARSSPRLHGKLLDHPRLGATLRLAEGRAMPRRAKVSALAAMWAGITLSCLVLDGALRLAVVAAGLAGTAAILFYVRTAPRSS